MLIRVYASKTKKYRERKLEIPVFITEHSPLCVVKLLYDHMTMHPGDLNGPLFLKGDVKLGLRPLLYRVMLKNLKVWVKRIGLDPSNVGLHSLCRSGATLMCRLGIPLTDIKCMGDWRLLAVLNT